MSLNLTIENCETLGHRVWLARLSAQEVKRLGGSGGARGNRSVVLVSNPWFDARAKSLVVRFGDWVVVNLGTTDQTVIVDTCCDAEEKDSLMLISDHRRESADRNREASVPSSVDTVVFGPGDRRFLDEIQRLPPPTASVGSELLARIRKVERGGDLVRSESARIYVERPRNFWAVKVQPVDQSYAISIYGDPEEYSWSKLEIKPGRKSYSRFKLRSTEELDEAEAIILAARDKYDLRG